MRPDAIAAALPELVRVAGARWTVEESFQADKGLAGLDEHQVRRWSPWRRWTLIAMLAHGPLAVIAMTEYAQDSSPAGLIPLTCNEVAPPTQPADHRTLPTP
jgi:SRSO17 transposase